MKEIKYLLAIVLLSSFIQPIKRKTKVYLIGDSTMSIKETKTYPETGWGMPFVYFFDSTIEVDNRAKNGRSTRTFMSENRWQPVVDDLQEGDYVFIQFGHNDGKISDSTRYTNPHTAYRYNLIKFVTESRNKGAIPVLFSSISRRNFNEYGTLIDSHNDYPLEMRLVANEYNVPFID